MRQIDWSKELSEDDMVWLRQTGIPGVEDRITKHQEQYGAPVQDPEVPNDTVTRSALDPNAGADAATNLGTGPQKVDPREADPQEVDEDEPDDYDTWSKVELDNEVTARNDLANKSDGTVSGVEVVGTGSNGAVKKEDLVKGLRLWDRENPDALS